MVGSIPNSYLQPDLQHFKFSAPGAEQQRSLVFAVPSKKEYVPPFWFSLIANVSVVTVQLEFRVIERRY